ncbi:Zinc carboxypeptidase A 1 [Frankliniella fusca]|uniref:Zinc carboxypeptidase A 1 n=1 Tax=Frankliniella fusca TaxID=407009 RepID=A0AAE1GRK6_9NEOP|nr:Zinc carboxypeptidase A 1 [Frankliniella fusca]
MHRAASLLCLLLVAAPAASELTAAEAPVIVDVEKVATGRSTDEAPEQRYDGHLVLRVLPRTAAEVVGVEEILYRDSELDAWRPPSRPGAEVHLRVPPWRLDRVIGDLAALSLNHTLVIQDVQRHIDNATRPTVRGDFGFDNYHRIDTIYGWMYQLARESGSAASVVSGGLSSEGRHILGVRLAHAPDLPVVIVEGGILGREWPSTAAAAFVLDQLVASSDPEVRRVARAYEWHVFPSVNPDGYEYAHTTDRLWSKSRSRTTVRCYGTDLNRNFPHQWGSAGVSWDYCSNLFPGARAASELETRTRMAYLKPLLRRTKAFVALHSYGQHLAFPWSHTASRAAGHDGLLTVAAASAEAFGRRHGTRLTTGSWAETLRPVSGTAMDWVHSRAVANAFSLGLRDSGAAAFLLPADQIVPAAEEALDGILGLLKAIV